MATRTYTEQAIQICDLTAFSEVPKKALIRRCCLIHLKKSSTCQRQRYSSVIVNAGKTKLLVRRHGPAYYEPPSNESRDDRAWNFARGDILRCLEGSPERSTERTPCTGIDPSTRRTSLERAPIAGDATTERGQRKMLHQLCKHQLASVHRWPPEVMLRR